MGWFQQPQKVNRPEQEAAASDSDTVEDCVIATANSPSVNASGSRVISRPPVTVEDVSDDEDEDHKSLSPSELSLREEEGLGDLEEIFARIQLEFQDAALPETAGTAVPSGAAPSPSQPTPTSNPSTQQRVPYVPGQLISFSRTDQSFSYTPAPKPVGPPGCPPSAQKAEEAIVKLNAILHPSRGPNTRGFKIADLNMILRARLELMISFLWLYASNGYTQWAKSADIIARAAGKGSWLSCCIREWVVAFIKDENKLPMGDYGKMNATVLEDEDLAQELHLHLQGLGKYVAAQDIVNYMATDEMKARLKLKNGISIRTAQRWMKRMQYCWTTEPKGMYSDGHERDDVVEYRQNVFLPCWA
ncbi:hypothetical protein B0H17DRAFT_936732 [Mycena rosella]|uniref:Uncharacterized protein n=1 Tax=Mycena rosella TaxID=1033263 RepID=A0AAD7DF93_MYCRO|nr:hypothetical protein B0H17DRAFT_936732 [Mycena rosella]